MSPRFDIPALLGELTIEEKASLVSGQGFWWTRRVERVGIGSIMVSDGPHGLRKQDTAGDHVGIGGSVPATCFPTASALASSWDVDLVRSVGDAIGAEARAQDLAVVLGPGINIKRSPLCGRNFEYLSEDPVLAGELGAALVDGIQGRGVGTSLKHYAVNNQEADRLRVSAEVDDRTLRELYLAGFERVVEQAGPWTVMCSYNRINGTYASQDHWLLTEVLRGEWGFDGLVVSDWGAVDDPVAAVAAGLDLEMPSTGGASAAAVAKAVHAGDLPEAVLDTAVERLLTLQERTLPGVEAVDEASYDDHHALARRVAADCVVLLKNAPVRTGPILELAGQEPRSRAAQPAGAGGAGGFGGDDRLLPLELSAGERVAVIGAFATTPRFQGAGSSKVKPTRVDDACTALRDALPADVTVEFAGGFGIDDPSADTAGLLAEAVQLADGVDVAVLFLGLPPSYESEGYDRDHLDLPAEQLALLAAVAAVNERVVVVLANGSVVAVEPWEHLAPAIVEGWLGGQAGGGAVVDVLLGTVNPSGRLAETMPLRLQDTPAYLNFPGEDRRVRYGEGLYVGYRHYDAVDRAVSYPFGHGLSYTTFEHADLSVTVLDPTADATGHWLGAPHVEVRSTVTNTGPVAGKEVVQVYVGTPDASTQRPVRELKAFAKVSLEPGASETVTFTLRERDLSYWSTRSGGWLREPGRVEVSVGASSRDLPLATTVIVGGERPSFPLDRNSTMAEWLDHPVGHEVLIDALKRAPGGDLSVMLDNPEQVRMLGSFPVPRLATMLGPAMGDDLVEGLLARLEER